MLKDRTWRSLPYLIYNYKVYPKISHLRGATRLLVCLRSIAELGIPKIKRSSNDIFAENWDNLIILDACRYDKYSELRDSGSRISSGSTSSEFIQENFSQRDFSEVIYVTANPHFHQRLFKELTGRYPEDVFYDIFRTFETDWDDENGVVMPEPLMRDARTARKLYPDKKVIVHFMQPHLPYVKMEEDDHHVNILDKDKEDYDSIMDKAVKGKFTREKVIEGYEQNLEFVLEPALELAEDLDGKTVLTSDHGEMLGENQIYGHWRGSKAIPLRKVPWDVVK